MTSVPVSELGAQLEEDAFLGLGLGLYQTEESVMLHTGLPQVLAVPVAGHVEANDCVSGLVLRTGGRDNRDRGRQVQGISLRRGQHHQMS